MTECGRLTVTDEIRADIEKYWGKEVLEATETSEIRKKLIDIVQEETDIAYEVTYASWEDEETIYYEYEDGEDEHDDDDAPARAFTEEYLNYIGMSTRDFY